MHKLAQSREWRKREIAEGRGGQLRARELEYVKRSRGLNPERRRTNEIRQHIALRSDPIRLEAKRAYGRAYSKANRDKCQAKLIRYRARKRDSASEDFTPLEVFERDLWVCGICHQKIDRRVKWPHPKSPAVDHIIPVSKGGNSLLSNVQCAHYGCNSFKRDRAVGCQLRML